MRWFLLVPVVLSLGAAAAVPDLADARVQGAWNITVTLTGYSGATPTFTRSTGVQGTDRVWFESACPTPSTCELRIWGPSGPDPSQGAFYMYTSNTTGFEGNAGDQLLLKSGAASYSNQIPISGFGGRISCGPPVGSPRPGQQLTITVTDAKKAGGGWLATTITGAETLTAGWGCNGTQTTGWSSEHLTLIGHPVGYVAPGPAPDRTSVVTVSSIASALNTPAQAFRSPLLIAANLFITALVILFVTFPAALFNHTLSDNYEEIAALARPLARLRLRLPTGARRDAAMFAAVVLVGAWIDGQLDAQFGFNGSSVISYVATVVNICFGVAYSAMVAMLYRRARKRDRLWHFRALPLGLVVAAACVFISRVTGFQPGYFYGLVVGVAFGTSLPKHEAGHTAAIASIVTMLMAVAAWFAWAAVNPSARAPGAGWPLVLLDDFLGSVFVGGLVGNVVGLLPLRSLQGGTLIGWSHGVWGVIFAVAVFGLVQVLLHPEEGAVHPSRAPLVTAVLLFVVFAGGSLAFNRYFAWAGRPTRRRQEAAAPA